MSELKPPTILVLTEHPQLAERLSAALASAAERVWLAAKDVPAAERVDVVVSDIAMADDARRLAGRFLGLDGDGRVVSHAAVLGLGPIDWADVVLPRSASDESLRVACMLLGEIARLRAQHDLADRVGRQHRELAYTDPLTGLANRRAWDDALAAIRSAPVTEKHGWCLAIVDLDRFKGVNEAHGLAAGDQLLQEVAAALSAALRQQDLVSRLGGDEFGVLLSNVTPKEAATILERLRSAVARRSRSELTTDLTASIGYVVTTDGAPDPSKLFSVAECALRAAKRSGGNQVILGTA